MLHLQFKLFKLDIFMGYSLNQLYFSHKEPEGY